MEERGRVVGDYMLGERIGSGSFAVVWRARHRQSGAEVAVKEIDKMKVDGKFREGLLKEITILRNISHPNIVRLYQAIQTEDRIFLVLEYCTGGDLAGYIQQHGYRGRVSEAVARHFMRQLAGGLQALRENNLIHRDLKPQNLLLSTSDEAPVLKIGDFGFARYLTPHGLADTLCGSPLYMAPEIMQDKQYDAKADLWSVGAILFQLVTGKLPFDGSTHYQLFQNIMASSDLHFPPEVLVNLHPDCIDLCRRLLCRNPVERLSFEEFFNHKFMAATSITTKALGCQTSVDVDFGDRNPSASSDVHKKTGSMIRPISYASTSKVSDSLDSIEKEYVLVHANFASTETLSSLEASMRDSSITRVASYAQTTGKSWPGPLQAGDPVCGLEGSGNCVFTPICLPRSSVATEDIQGEPFHPATRLQLLNHYINTLTELAREKLFAGSHLESFSIELMSLALWKEALHICNLWAASMAKDAFITSTDENLFHPKDHVPEGVVEGIDFTRPLSVCSWAERGFISAYDRAEEISSNSPGINDNVVMPDAMEIIYQAALAAGKSGAVYELMRQWNGAITSYSKAITLLTFILVEAASLPLNPPFSLSPSNQHRIRKYIMNLRTHLYNSQMTVRHPGEQQ
ncbi:serine/threonine-protein kinase ATG1a isoform X1 [Ananas comosus]|uniref:Serine/threonine-protein kinase ATG1a isoform X1 n=1 Tax=Ananas comosus TaxID=4615 RepID=A0A6P5EN77_ANACO|nr:serine/threonine-protein kinase ATG1a isoform X1 [Ananas comosus]